MSTRMARMTTCTSSSRSTSNPAHRRTPHHGAAVQETALPLSFLATDPQLLAFLTNSTRKSRSPHRRGDPETESEKRPAATERPPGPGDSTADQHREK